MAIFICLTNIPKDVRKQSVKKRDLEGKKKVAKQKSYYNNKYFTVNVNSVHQKRFMCSMEIKHNKSRE